MGGTCTRCNPLKTTVPVNSALLAEVKKFIEYYEETTDYEYTEKLAHNAEYVFIITMTSGSHILFLISGG